MVRLTVCLPINRIKLNQNVFFNPFANLIVFFLSFLNLIAGYSKHYDYIKCNPLINVCSFVCKMFDYKYIFTDDCNNHWCLPAKKTLILKDENLISAAAGDNRN